MPKTKQPNNIFKKVIEEVIEEKLPIFDIKVDRKLEGLKEEIESKADERHSEVMKSLDTVMGMFKNHDEAHIILSDQQRRINESSEKLDRLEKIHPHGQHSTI